VKTAKNLRRNKMKDLKTTLTGVIGGLSLIVSVFGFDATPEFQASLIAVVMGVMGWFAKQV
jgi:hypothetical protein